MQRSRVPVDGDVYGVLYPRLVVTRYGAPGAEGVPAAVVAAEEAARAHAS